MTAPNEEFIAEAEEILERLREDVVDLADQRVQGQVDPDPVNRMFRAAHSLKGLAGMFGLQGVGDLSHRLEDLLDGLRMGRVALVAGVVELVEEVIALFALLVTADPEEMELEDLIQTMIDRLATALDGDGAAADPDELPLDESVLRALTEYEEHRLRENLREGRSLLWLHRSFEILAFEEGLSELSAAVREQGEVLATLPSPGESIESEIRFALLVATECDADTLREELDFDGLVVEEVVAGRAVEAPARDSRAAPAGESAEPEAFSRGGPLESLKSISETVRVDIRKLDALMTLVGELGIARAAVTQMSARLLSDPQTRRLGGELSKVDSLFERRLKELQASVLDVRMVPMRRVFEKLSRVIRGLQRDAGKEVELDFQGADTELDKLIVEELIDPLMHIVRNAFDHAIEPAEERRAAGKSDSGRIRIAASQRGNHVVVEVSDDGRGLDPERVRERAIERGLIDPEETLSRKECLDLVFLPGLSTRDEVSETSGRGVGMDVVRSNMTSLGVSSTSVPKSEWVRR